MPAFAKATASLAKARGKHASGGGPALRRVSAWVACVVACCATVGAQELTEAQLVQLIVRDGAQARAIRLGPEVVRREQAARAVLANPSIAYTREGAGFTEFLQAEQFL